MSLTEEEKKIVMNGTQKIIDRLLAENEELKLEREVNMEMLNRYIDRCKFYEAKLDAIKKAWEPIKDCSGLTLDIKALDRLIGGGK